MENPLLEIAGLELELGLILGESVVPIFYSKR